jgi:hypothetical protein
MKKERSKIALQAIVAFVMGFAIGKIDTSPHWNDTGLIAMAVGAISAILGFINPKLAWLWAILVGAPIALLNMFIAKNYGAVGVLLFSFAGAYAGFLVRRLVHI